MTTAKKRSSAKTAGEKAKARSSKTTLVKWMAMVKQQTASGSDAGEETGACLLPNPAGGPRMCVQVTKATCKTLKGRFVGGPC